jgi:hypothetical protein
MQDSRDPRDAGRFRLGIEWCQGAWKEIDGIWIFSKDKISSPW